MGRLKTGAERDLVDDYLRRAEAQGRNIALTPFAEKEIDARSLSGASVETGALVQSLPSSAIVIALDERGKSMDSRAFSTLIGGARDDGARDMVFLIGGADGMDRAMLPPGTRLLSLGAMVWPHRLVRVMLAEQLYRAAALLSGAPYHRD